MLEPKDSIIDRFAPLFMPRTVAVVGASAKTAALPNIFIQRIRRFGFTGTIYPIHPDAETIEGLPAYKNFTLTPQPIDYAYIAIPASKVPPLLAGAKGRVRFAQVISSGFGENEAGVELQSRLVDAAREGGMRLLGPNCMGTYSPRGRITYTENAGPEIGDVGIVSQSGGLSTDIIRRGLVRGLKFSGVVSIGNSADVDAIDLLQFYLADDQTKVIGLYLESSRQGRRLFEVLRAAGARKPVIILKGGRTTEGALAASSHTGALAGDERIWTALGRQTGSIFVETLSEFIDVLLAAHLLKARPGRPTRNIVLFGNGGGASVLGTDSFSRAGLSVPRFAQNTIDALAALHLPPGTSITNPIDAPVGTLQQDDGRVAEKILEIVLSTAVPDAVVMHLSMPAFSGRTKPEVLANLVQAALRVQDRLPGLCHFLLVLRSDGMPEIEKIKWEFRQRAIELDIAVYDELEDAARALAAVAFYERFVASRTILVRARA